MSCVSASNTDISKTADGKSRVEKEKLDSLVGVRSRTLCLAIYMTQEKE